MSRAFGPSDGRTSAREKSPNSTARTAMFLASDQVRADKAVRAPGSVLPEPNLEEIRGDLLLHKLYRCPLRHFVRARLVGGRFGRAFVGSNHFIGQQISFDLFAAHVGEHASVDLHAGAEHLTA